MSFARFHATVRGMVQGVGFRAFAVRQARALGLTGYVKNEYDGSVSVVAEGAKEALEQFLGELHRGPGSSSVREVETSWSEAGHDLVEFEVRF